MSEKPASDAHRETSPSTPPPTILPPANELERLESIVPGVGQRIFAQWEAQLEHQRHMEARGLAYALSVSVLGLIASSVLVLIGILTREPVGTVTGGVLGGLDIAALAIAFIRGRSG
jgi:uncharacterized membrane protein